MGVILQTLQIVPIIFIKRPLITDTASKTTTLHEKHSFTKPVNSLNSPLHVAIGILPLGPPLDEYRGINGHPEHTEKPHCITQEAKNLEK